MNMMNWWRWNHEIGRWQTDDNFTNSDSRDLKCICLDKLGSRLVQRTCSRCIWWRFSRGMMQDLSKTIWIQSFLDCIFIIRNGSKFIGCAFSCSIGCISHFNLESQYSWSYHLLSSQMSPYAMVTSLLTNRRHYYNFSSNCSNRESKIN